jgi:hypothetical protein
MSYGDATMGNFMSSYVESLPVTGSIITGINARSQRKLEGSQLRGQELSLQRSEVAAEKNIEAERVEVAMRRSQMSRQLAVLQGTTGAMSSGRGGGDKSTIQDINFQSEQDMAREMEMLQLGSTLRQEAIDAQRFNFRTQGGLTGAAANEARRSAGSIGLMAGFNRFQNDALQIGMSFATGGASLMMGGVGNAPQQFVGPGANSPVTGRIVGLGSSDPLSPIRPNIGD